MFYVYILQSQKDKNLYTGSAKDLKKRILEHNCGLVENTKSRIPFNLIYYEACLAEKDARTREKYLKSGMGKKFIKNRLKYFLNHSK
jgi:putative endonuclease